MAIARLIVLIILVPFLAAVGSGNNTAAAICTGLLFIVAPILYFLPSIEAKLNESDNLMSVLMVNLFLGWTLVGWVVALAWAHKKPPQQFTPTYEVSPPPPRKAGDEKVCPYCAEVVKAAAIKCRHCGSELS